MKRKYCKKDKKVAKKSKAPVSKKKIVSKKKAARKFIVSPESTPLGIKQLREAHPGAEIVTLGFEQSASDPIDPDQQAEIIEPETEAA